MKLSSYLSEKAITLNLKGENIEELIENLLINSFENGILNSSKSKDDILKAILKREREASTYLGHGITLPHARLEGFDDIFIAIGFPEKKVLAQNSCGKMDKVDVVILIIADVLKGKKILKIMSGISRLVINHKGVLDKLLNANTPHKVLEILENSNIEIDHNITAEDLMTNTLLPVSDTATLEEVATKIIMENITGAPVVDKNNNFLGEITERELIAFGMPKYTTILDDLTFMTVGEPFEDFIKNEKTTTINNLYRYTDIVTVDRDASLMEVSYLFMTKKVTRIYVIEEGKYLGMILRSDIIKKILHI